jgi:hypothetical protein
VGWGYKWQGVSSGPVLLSQSCLCLTFLPWQVCAPTDPAPTCSEKANCSLFLPVSFSLKQMKTLCNLTAPAISTNAW